MEQILGLYSGGVCCFSGQICSDEPEKPKSFTHLFRYSLSLSLARYLFLYDAMFELQQVVPIMVGKFGENFCVYIFSLVEEESSLFINKIE